MFRQIFDHNLLGKRNVDTSPLYLQPQIKENAVQSDLQVLLMKLAT